MKQPRSIQTYLARLVFTLMLLSVQLDVVGHAALVQGPALQPSTEQTDGSASSARTQAESYYRYTSGHVGLEPRHIFLLPSLASQTEETRQPLSARPTLTPPTGRQVHSLLCIFLI